MRWLMIAIACAGCPGIEPTPDREPAPELPPTPSIDEPLPPSNCPRGTAPPITWCREMREGYSTASASQSSSGPLYIQDWTNGDSSGHVETLYGDGFPIERHAHGAFASHMTTVCNEDGRVSIEHSAYAATRTYFDTANRPLSGERDENFDGVFESRDFFTYDDAGRMVRDDHDGGPGTAVDRVVIYDYDADGRMSTATIDRDGDGDIDSTMINDWDDLDRRTMQEQYEHSELVARWLWTYDGPRELTTEIEGTYRWTNSHDERDRVIDYVLNNSVDGTVDEHIAWEYCR